MSRKILYILGAVSIGTLALASACGDDTTTATTGGGASGATGGSTASSGGSTASSGGAASCGNTCSEYLLDTTGNIALADVCGADANSPSECNMNASSSCNLVLAVGACVCGIPGGAGGAGGAGVAGMCLTECLLSCTGMGMDMANCMTCSTTNCAGATNDCLADQGVE